MTTLRPAEIVAQLDRYIVNQPDAKRAVALALRNRERRQRIEPRLGSLAQTPHVLLIGPSGVGKTTLVLRAAEITGAPLVRADAAWLNDRNNVGRAAAQLVTDLIDIELRDLSSALGQDQLAGEGANAHRRRGPRSRSETTPAGVGGSSERPPPGTRPRRPSAARRANRERAYAAIDRVERHGIVLLDDVDRLATRDAGDQHEPAGEGLQRALTPLLDGTDVVTAYGPVRTAQLLFIATGAFTATRVADLVPEFVARFPVRVELQSLDIDDFERILTTPERSLRDYYIQLLATDGISVDFTSDGVREIAVLAAELNARGSDLGARRLVHVMEHVLEDVSFDDAKQVAAPAVNAAYVRERCADLFDDEDFEQYIL